MPEFVTRYQKVTLSFLRRYGHHIIILLACVFFFLSFIPFFSSSFLKFINDDFAGHRTENCIYLESTISPLMVALLPGVDLLLDLLAPLTSMSYSKLFESSSQELDPQELADANVLAAKTTRLSKIERIVFWVGVLSASLSVFPVYQNASPYRAYLLYSGFSLNGNMLFTICPILSFLCRSSTTWTPTITISITLCLCAASSLATADLTVFPSGVLYDNLVLASASFMTIACAIYFITWIYSAYLTYLWFKAKGSKLSKVEDSLAQFDLLNEEQFHFAVVAAQSSATMIDMALNVYWYWYAPILTPGSQLLSNIFFVVSGSAVLTFLIEFRVRKSEVSTALYALLDSKKSYVRYISHELRTPMNVALLGVALSRNDVKENANPDWGDGVVETLEDVELACSTAVNILNDLLSFEKMESGILELHKEPIVVLSFVNDCVRIFSLQAREKGVNMKVNLALSDEDLENGLCALVPTDVVMGDRFKLEQVLRNLVSNALKFSPAGSTVTLSCFFRPVAFDASVSSKSSKKTSVSSKKSGSIKQAFGSLKSSFSPRSMKEYAIQSSFKNSKSTAQSSKSSMPSRKGSSKKRGAADSMGRLVIRCTDQGAGISPENQAKLFRGVVQFSPEKLQAGGGSGFGMFISKGIVELHKGIIGVWSKGEGFGTTFTMEIPMQRTIGDVSATVIRPDTILESKQHEEDDRSSYITMSDIVTIEMTIPEHRRENEAGDDDDDEEEEKKDDDDFSQRSRSSNGSASSPGQEILIGIAPEDEGKPAADDDVSTTSSVPSKSANSVMKKSNLFGSAEVGSVAVASASVVAAASASPEQLTPVSDTSVPTTVVTPNVTPRVAGGAPQYRLLIVDDSGMNRKMMVKTMKAKGHTCEEAEDGLLAVEKVKSQLDKGQYYDGILMDFIMPNMDGPSATRAIREMGVQTTVLGLTGNCMQRDIDWFKSCGANDVLAKPLVMADFERRMIEFGPEKK